MKVEKLKLLSVMSLAVGLIAFQAAADVASVKATLAGVSGLELPKTTAGLVASAADQEKSAVTVSATEVAVGMNPSAASAIVAAVAAKVPEMAPVAAATAAKLQPKQAPLIVEAASKAAPTQAAAIVAACSKELPYQYARLAIAASKAAPQAKGEILVAASKASPAPVRAQLTAAAAAPAMASVPMDVTLARAYAHPSIAAQVSAINGLYAPGPSGEVLMPLTGPRIILTESTEWVGSRINYSH